ncbi:zinc finger protein ZAT1-like [Abrus precatorius]|uniref:Zinc finger protein ZAT1-like n=1 Tax=Abrus precatorius TaxID=3816 RepID=A0A8B8KZN8_ABRPR|nr:zinc finger protein ZAT1-like [Abrus precatorius]
MKKGPGAGVSAGLDNNEHHSWMCHICNKGFSSGKALGGHMRIHNISRKQVHKAKQGTTSAAKTKAKTWVLMSGNPTCYLCRKSFSSMKSLFAHMRSHPQRLRKVFQPHNNTPKNVASSNSTSSSTLSDDSAVDLSQALWGWSVTAKRGRRSLSCGTVNSGLEHHGIEQRMQEAVYELMLLASGNPKRGEKVAGDNKVELSPVSLSKKLKVEAKSLNKMGFEEELLKSSFGNCDGSTDMKNKNRKRKRETKRMELTELKTAEEDKKLVRSRISNATFPSNIALEGHLSNHKNSKNIQIMDELETDGVSATEEEEETAMQVDETGTAVGCCTVESMTGHQCKIFNKTLSMGQVSGDHKRSHWTGMAEAHSAQATSPVEDGQNCSNILSFDLNQYPAMDDEVGVQSDLSIPSNIMTSSSYGSSSQNSY